MSQDKTIALALAIAALPLAAHADVTVYGFLSGGVESVKASGAGDAGKTLRSGARVVDNNSRIGFRGSEDLGAGLAAVWQVESGLRNFEQGGVNDKGETAVLATRNSFVGLQGAFGSVQLGHYDSAYKRLPGGVGLNLFGDTAGDTHGGTGLFSRRETRLKNSVHYTSPTVAGLQAGVSYGVDEARPSGTADGRRQNDDRLSLGLAYTDGGVRLGAGYDREGSRLDAGGTQLSVDKTEGYKLAAGYQFATGTFVGAGVERVRVDYRAAPATVQQSWLLAASQRLGVWTLRAGYGELGRLEQAQEGTPGEYRARQWLLGAGYELSRRTQLYAYATRIDNDSRASVNFVTNPLYSEGAGSAAASLSRGNDPQAAGIGMKVAF